VEPRVDMRAKVDQRRKKSVLQNAKTFRGYALMIVLQDLQSSTRIQGRVLKGELDQVSCEMHHLKLSQHKNAK
jgi:hypothetical protein